MKHTAIFFVAILCCTGLAWQAPAAPLLAMGTATITQGESGEITLNVSDGTGSYAGVNAIVTLPDGVAVTGIATGDVLTNEFGKDFYFNDEENWGSVVAYSGTGTFSAQNGTLLKLSLQVSADVPTGTYPVQITVSGLSNEDGSVSETHSTVNGSIIVNLQGQEQHSYILWTK